MADRPFALRALGLLERLAWLLARGVAWVARAAIVHRAAVAAVLTRLAWFAALWLLIDAARTLFDARVAVAPEQALLQFAGGLALCWVVVVFARARRLRWTAIAMGTAHGALGLLLWAIVHGAPL